MTTKDIKLYNLLLPIWLIVFIPSWLWLILIPANYLLDRIVLGWSLGSMPDKGVFCRKHNWKICLAGFLSDLVGAILLLIVTFGGGAIMETGGDNTFAENFTGGLMANPFANALSLLITLAAIALAGACIYFCDRRILEKAGLDVEAAKRSAVRLALITAPYLYLVPSSLLYRGGL